MPYEKLIEKNDLVTLDYILFDSEGIIFDTTLKSVGERLLKKTVFKPITVRVGAHQLPAPVEDALIGMRESAAKSIEVLPEDAFGLRREDLVQIIPISDFKSTIPETDKPIYVLGKAAKIKEVKDDKIILDFNHPLAGQKVKYTIIVKQIEKQISMYEAKQ